MPFKDPLTFADPRAIRERQPWNPDVLSLLWEVKRLRAAILRRHQVSFELKRPAGLAKEPCVGEGPDDGRPAGIAAQTAQGDAAALAPLVRTHYCVRLSTRFILGLRSSTFGGLRNV